MRSYWLLKGSLAVTVLIAAVPVVAAEAEDGGGVDENTER